MFFFLIFFLFVAVVLFVLIFGLGLSDFFESFSGSPSHYGTYNHTYDDEDYSDYETAAARGERDYLSGDCSRDYDSYYAQIADDAMMGDESAIEEMRGEFGCW